MGIGKTLLEVLNEKGSNPNELADKIGVNPSTIYSIIRRDNMKVDISVLAQICQTLGVDMDRFYSEYINEAKTTMYLSSHEKELIIAYRSNPGMQEAVDTLLGVSSECQKQKRA